MTRFQFTLILMVGVLLIVGCSKPAAPPAPASSTPKDPEEAALKVVAFVYGNYARYKKQPPQGWGDLEGFTSMMDSTARPQAEEAIKKIKSLNYKMTWGVDFKRMNEEGLKPTEFVIGESPDGHLKVTYNADIIKNEADKNEAEKVEQKEPAPETKSNDSSAPE